ncbi:hypothetical protein ABZ192_24345 [Streptomyces sp. NPDC006235]|uniref:hypothetical protein n=1 Tax=Streptomyces sp. NPDC006235 TaxID=3156736 RepID=UPI0033A1829D
MPARLGSLEAIRLMREAGFEPLDEYVNSSTPWRSRHIACGAIVTPRLSNLRNSKIGCQPCGVKLGSRTRSLDEETAVARLRKAGLEPLEPYVNSHEPWRCRHLACGREVTPVLNRLRTQGGCVYCAGCAPVTLEEAAADMRAAGYEPLEPYVNSHEPWRCRHLACGREVTATLNRIRSGTGCCWACGVAKRTATTRLAKTEAEARLRAAGYEPMADYPGSKMPWPAVHLACGQAGTPRLSDLGRRTGCRSCGIESRVAARRGDQAEAIARMREADLEPLEDYKSRNTPWMSIHLPCRQVVYPRLGGILAGQGGCRSCADKQSADRRRTDTELAVARMRDAGFLPLVAFQSTSRPWRSLHLACRQIVTPTLASIDGGQGGCVHCHPGGLDREAPAVVYVLAHPHHNAVKVGVTGNGTSRLAQFSAIGWDVVATLPFETGAQALTVETAVKRRLATELGLSHFLTAEVMGNLGGHTETFDSDRVSPSVLLAMAAEERSRVPVQRGHGKAKTKTVL